VFSHESKIALINTARQAGFEIVLIIVCHDNIDLLVQRVLWRAAHGKHMVPAEKIRQRYQRTLNNLRAAIRLVDVAMLFDNGGSPTEIEATVPELIAVLKFGTVVERCPGVVPAWAKLILTGLPNLT